MSLNGTPVDLYERKYSPIISAELQQKGSLLRGLCQEEKGEGESYSFSRIGAVSDSYEVNSRFTPIVPSSANFQRRIILPQPIVGHKHVDMLDLERGAKPQSMIANAIGMELGRKLDALILNALGGSITTSSDGTQSQTAFDSNNTIAYNDTSFASATVSVNTLHEGKIKFALKKLAEAYVDLNEEIFVVGSATQFVALQTRLEQLGTLDRNIIGQTVLNRPGIATKLTGYQGLTFIQHQLLSRPEFLSSGNEYVYVFPKSALMLLMWSDVTVRVVEDTNYVGFPILIHGKMTAGAGRTDEAKVVRILNSTS